jgi:phosphoserine phosphatase
MSATLIAEKQRTRLPVRETVGTLLSESQDAVLDRLPSGNVSHRSYKLDVLTELHGRLGAELEKLKGS